MIQWLSCEGQVGHDAKANGEAMARCQVNSIFQSYPHDHIHSEEHYYMSDKQAMNFCDLKTRHYKPRNFTNKFVGYVRYFVVFCSLSVNFVVYVRHL